MTLSYIIFRQLACPNKKCLFLLSNILNWKTNTTYVFICKEYSALCFNSFFLLQLRMRRIQNSTWTNVKRQKRYAFLRHHTLSMDLCSFHDKIIGFHRCTHLNCEMNKLLKSFVLKMHCIIFPHKYHDIFDNTFSFLF